MMNEAFRNQNNRLNGLKMNFLELNKMLNEDSTNKIDELTDQEQDSSDFSRTGSDSCREKNSMQKVNPSYTH